MRRQTELAAVATALLLIFQVIAAHVAAAISFEAGLADQAQRYFAWNEMIPQSLISFVEHDSEMLERAERFEEVATPLFEKADPAASQDAAEIETPEGLSRFFQVRREMESLDADALEEEFETVLPLPEGDRRRVLAARLPGPHFGAVNMAVYEASHKLLQASPRDIARADSHQLSEAASHIASLVGDETWRAEDRDFAREYEIALNQLVLSRLSDPDIAEIEAFLDEVGGAAIERMNTAYEDAVRETVEKISVEYFATFK